MIQRLKQLMWFALLAASNSAVLLAADTQLPGTNQIQGVVRFTNTDPDILARLGPPGDEGMRSLAVIAYTDPPELLQSTKLVQPTDPLSQPYDLTVAADHTPRIFNLYAYLVLDSDHEEYWTAPVTSGPITSNPPPALVNLEECVALLELRYQRANGTPVAAAGGRALVYEISPTPGLRACYLTQPAGREANYVVVPSNVELSIDVEADTGSDIYL
ncbi:MAG: hypothetical protein FJ405_10410, partial [Verrucomicrobia bacterium]|nr:hypothetical protein [Verrucomicrobiota bacterium]